MSHNIPRPPVPQLALHPTVPEPPTVPHVPPPVPQLALHPAVPQPPPVPQEPPTDHIPLGRRPVVEASVPAHDMGPMTVICQSCRALHWMAERLTNSSDRTPTLSSNVMSDLQEMLCSIILSSISIDRLLRGSENNLGHPPKQ